MESSPSCSVIEISPNSVEIIRKEYNLDGPGRMEETVNILHEWIQKQAHFKKKDFTTSYLERSIITCKGSIERAKKQIDTMCTVKTLTPELFSKNINDIKDSLGLAYVFHLPKTTDDFYRVNTIKLLKSDFTSEEMLNISRLCFILGEYMRLVDYVRGFLMVWDLTGINILECIRNANLFQIKHTLEVIIGGYGMRLKGLHFITDSKMVDVFISFTKQVVSSKIAGRIYVHKNYKELHKVISPRILPKDFGGDQKTSKEMMDEWIKELSIEENVAYCEEMCKAGTDESLRHEKSQFFGEYVGMAGTFRSLSVD